MLLLNKISHYFFPDQKKIMILMDKTLHSVLRRNFCDIFAEQQNNNALQEKGSTILAKKCRFFAVLYTHRASFFFLEKRFVRDYRAFL
jgi:hypothetical protein